MDQNNNSDQTTKISLQTTAGATQPPKSESSAQNSQLPPNQVGNTQKKAIVLLLIVVLVIVVLGIILWFVFSAKPATAPNQVSTQANVNNQTPASTPLPKPEEISLLAIAPYSGTATSTRLFNAEVFTNTISANTTDPAPGKFYEGWLVDKSGPKPIFFSTGKLVKEGQIYKLNYTSNKNPVGYNQVVITEETTANGLDGKPEAHVFEGTFPQ